MPYWGCRTSTIWKVQHTTVLVIGSRWIRTCFQGTNCIVFYIVCCRNSQISCTIQCNIPYRIPCIVQLGSKSSVGFNKTEKQQNSMPTNNTTDYIHRHISLLYIHHVNKTITYMRSLPFDVCSTDGWSETSSFARLRFQPEKKSKIQDLLG